MKTKANVKAGGVNLANHNEWQLRSCGLRVQAGVKAGAGGADKNQDPPAK